MSDKPITCMGKAYWGSCQPEPGDEDTERLPRVRIDDVIEQMQRDLAEMEAKLDAMIAQLERAKGEL